MAERRRVLVLGLLLAMMGACLDFDLSSAESDDPRLLDRACDPPDVCELGGAAELTGGITSDSVGFRLGPHGASVQIPLQRSSFSGELSLEILAAGHGDLEVTLTGAQLDPKSAKLTADYEWHELHGSFPTNVTDSQTQVELVLSTSWDASAEIADIRALHLDYPHGCSVAGVGR